MNPTLLAHVTALLPAEQPRGRTGTLVHLRIDPRMACNGLAEVRMVKTGPPPDAIREGRRFLVTLNQSDIAAARNGEAAPDAVGPWIWISVDHTPVDDKGEPDPLLRW
jgi:hypothetical protein